MTAIQLYGEFLFMAIEIENVGFNRMLAAEFAVGNLPVAEQLPEKGFCISLVFSQLAGVLQ